MVDRLRRWIRLIAAAALLCCVLLPGAWAAEGEAGSATILFTHDLHSSFLPRKDGAGGTAGGYARLASALKEERSAHPGALTVDGGDFSVGSLIQTLYPTQAAELRTMGAMGYDAVTVGNHEFDYTGPGFGEMLTAARRSGEKTPALLLANYRPEEDSPDRLDLQRAMAAYGVEESMLLERGGVTYGIFGLMGRDAHACAPTSGFALEAPVRAARRCVERLEEQVYFQERTLSALNEAITLQQRQLDDLQGRMEAVEEKFRELWELVGNEGGEATVPPHYMKLA